MPDPTPTTAATPDLAAQLQSLTTIVTELAKGQQAIVTALAAKPNEAAAVTATEKDGKEKPKALTAADVQQAIADALKAERAASAKSATRTAFIAEQLKGLPAAYHGMIPDTDDATALAAAGKAARTAYETDFKILGGNRANVGGDNPGGQPPGDKVDTSKLSAYDLIGLGIKGQTPVVRSPEQAAAQPAQQQAAAAK